MEEAVVSRRKEVSPFRKKLEAALDEPFDMNQLAELWEEINRKKPVTQRRETRKRSLEVLINEEGLSYLDQHQDFAEKLMSTANVQGKLKLLRGFFCWLQYACIPGSFKPWVDPNHASSDEDCLVTDGPDDKIVVVDLSQEEDRFVSLPKQGLPSVFQSTEDYIKRNENVKFSLHRCVTPCALARMDRQHMISAQQCAKKNKCIKHQNPQLIMIDDDDRPWLDQDISPSSLVEEAESLSPKPKSLSLILKAEVFVEEFESTNSKLLQPSQNSMTLKPPQVVIIDDEEVNSMVATEHEM
ncbi:hypothetical protein O6H91_01G051600 [Diphasiastrum complanatum]|uniref:Uncharacterized protein n=1 Tax=Diphasiastrum complanatum TaxID=34168 RepID=A0ACC2ER62_DIPCM|nr:hypothetical protein O6H91_01G051600 [Diphasiastrum complanatum]